MIVSSHFTKVICYIKGNRVVTGIFIILRKRPTSWCTNFNTQKIEEQNGAQEERRKLGEWRKDRERSKEKQCKAQTQQFTMKTRVPDLLYSMTKRKTENK